MNRRKAFFFNTGTAFTGLDAVKSQMVAAFSVSKLFTTSTNAVRLRRSSDSAQQDFGFVNNLLDTASITTFAGGSNLFLVTWYDQSGNGNHVTQANASAQPKFATTNADNGLPIVNIDGAGTRYISKTLTQGLPYTFYGFLKQVSEAQNNVFVDFGAGLLNGLVQRGSTDGGAALTIIAGTNWKPVLKEFYNAKFSAYRFGNQVSGNCIASMDKDPIIGGNATYPLMQVGTSTISKLQIGDNAGSTPNFNAQTMLLLNGTTTDPDDTKIKTYLSGTYSLQPTTPIIMFGDSITLGAASSNFSTLSYVELTSTALGYNLYNYGLSGSDIGYGGPTSDDLGTLYNTVELGLNKNAWITFCYGANSSSATNPGWQTLFQQCVQYMIDQGFNPNRMCMVLQLYQSNKLSYLIPACNAMKAIATNLGMRVADCYTAGFNAGGDALLTDGTHPNDTGHALMAQVLEAALS